MRSTLLFLMMLFPFITSANVVGVDAQNFNPTTNGLDFVTVHSSKTLSPGVINFGLFFNYAVNTLPNYVPVTTQSLSEPKDTLLSADVNMGVGLTDNWEIGISLPHALSQSVEEDSVVFSGQFENTGINEIRVNSKYRLWNGRSQGLAVIGSANFFLIEDYPYIGNNSGPSLNLELAYDRRVNNWVFGVNAGYRFRDPGDPVLVPAGLPLPYGDQAIASVAASYYFQESDFKLIGEVFSSYPTEDTEGTSDRDIASMELLVGAKWDLMYNLAGHVGAGTELFHGTGSPDIRVYAGLNWAIGPVFGSPDRFEYLEQVEEEMTASYYFATGKGIFDRTPTVGTERFIAKNVLFDFNGASVKPKFKAELKKLADYLLKGAVFKKLVIEGHTDSVGAKAYNMDLSVRRAQSVAAVMKEILPKKYHDRVGSRGRGEEKPIASNANYQGRALNRRVEFFVTR